MAERQFKGKAGYELVPRRGEDGSHIHRIMKAHRDGDVALGEKGHSATPARAVAARPAPAMKPVTSDAEKSVRRLENKFIYGTAAGSAVSAAATAAFSAGTATAGSMLGASLTSGTMLIGAVLTAVFTAFSLVQRRQRRAAGI